MPKSNPFDTIEITEDGTVTHAAAPVVDEVIETEETTEEETTEDVVEDIAEEETETEADKPRTIGYRYFGEDKEYDPFADEEETRTLLQKGMDFDNKAGIKDLLDKGALLYDVESGGLKVAERVTNEAETKGANAVIDHLVKQGLLQRDAAGAASVPAKVLAALAAPATNADSDRLAELATKMKDDGSKFTAAEWEEFTDLKIAVKLSARDAEAEQKLTAKQQHTAQTDALTKALGTADENIDVLGAKLKANWGTDTKGFNTAVKRCKLITRAQDAGGKYQYEAAIADLSEEATKALALQKMRALSKKPQTKRTTSATGRTSSTKSEADPASGRAKAIDHARPFAHLANPVTAED